MSAYYPGLACWFLSDHYKAAYNSLLVDPTAELLGTQIMGEATVKARALLEKVGFPSKPTPQVINCFLAQALAEMEICPRMKRTDGSVVVVYWYRVNNIPDACGRITDADLDKAIAWLTGLSRKLA